MFLLILIHTLCLAILALIFYESYRFKSSPFNIPGYSLKMRPIVAGVVSLEAIFLMQGILHIFDIVDFDKYFQYVIVTPYLILSLGWLISFPILLTVHQKKREALSTHKPDNAAIRIALEAGHVSEAMRLYKAVNCLNEDNVKAILRVLPPLPIREALEECISEILALQYGSNNAIVAGAPKELVSKLNEESENALNTVWIITDRVVAVSRQNIDSPRIRKALNTHKKKILHLTKAVHEFREDFADWTLRGWDIADIDKAQQNLSDFLVQYRIQMDSND